MDRWAALDEDDIHLATIRVCPHPAGIGKPPRIILFLPPNRDPIHANSQPGVRTGYRKGPSLAHPHIFNWPIFEWERRYRQMETNRMCMSLISSLRAMSIINLLSLNALICLLLLQWDIDKCNGVTRPLFGHG
ncbi:hypothetical protein BKA70DRAFT_232958 [Coprinopsis sp. MPI-PUGE-AT-0042]|nr:hypothetical protein BKA70DRAFT_232958 [Coprinopsis sp. MPI-PUGE-AT-0042]